MNVFVESLSTFEATRASLSAKSSWLPITFGPPKSAVVLTCYALLVLSMLLVLSCENAVAKLLKLLLTIIIC